MPKAPVTLSIVDACGDLSLTQKICFENYRQANPNLISHFTFTKAPEPRTTREDSRRSNRLIVSISISCLPDTIFSRPD